MMNSTEYTERLIEDLENYIAHTAAAHVPEMAVSFSKHLSLLIQLINSKGESYLTYADSEAVDLLQVVEELKLNRNEIALRMQQITEEDPFVTLPDNQSLANEMIIQLDIIHQSR